MWENVRIEGTGPPVEGQGAGSLAARVTPLDYPSTSPQPPHLHSTGIRRRGDRIPPSHPSRGRQRLINPFLPSEE